MVGVSPDVAGALSQFGGLVERNLLRGQDSADGLAGRLIPLLPLEQPFSDLFSVNFCPLSRFPLITGNNRRKAQIFNGLRNPAEVQERVIKTVIRALFRRNERLFSQRKLIFR
jgi:hypothetical protein